MITYEYDEGGNIQNKKEYFYYGGNASSRPSETITYTYGNTNWRDKLTSYNGKEVTYDEIGNIIGLNYNNTQYYYIRNGQNDVIGILDSNLNQVVSYEYDSLGNTISIKDANGNNITSSSNIGIINPYRYRSYRYDIETGLYYLNSRYYNPEWGRFINFDSYGGQVGEIYKVDS